MGLLRRQARRDEGRSNVDSIQINSLINGPQAVPHQSYTTGSSVQKKFIGCCPDLNGRILENPTVFHFTKSTSLEGGGFANATWISIRPLARVKTKPLLQSEPYRDASPLHKEDAAAGAARVVSLLYLLRGQRCSRGCIGGISGSRHKQIPLYPSWLSPCSHHADSCFNALMTLSSKDFRQLTRISKRSFCALHDYIYSNPVFHSTSPNANHSQQSVSLRLAVGLGRLGQNGNGASVGQLHRYFKISVGSVVKYTKRVLVALRDVRSSWIEWPSRCRRQEISQVMAAEGFPGCVGFIDGTTLPLAQRPGTDGSSYFDRKKRYSVAMQMVCDNDKRIIAAHCGCPGSCADANVFKRMGIYRNPGYFFFRGEYLLADSAYPSLSTVLPAYKRPLADDPDNTEFNYYLAKSRVRNEHAIGVLKSRWGSLREMRNQLRSKVEMDALIEWVLGCCVLHNMLAKLGDAWRRMVLESDNDDGGSDFSEAEQEGAVRERVKPITLAFHRMTSG